MIIKMEEKPKEVVPPLSKTRMHFTSFLVVLSRIMVSILLITSNSSTTLNTSNNTTITTSSTLITPSSINHLFSSPSQSQLHLKSKRNQKYQLLQSSAISLNSQLLSTKRGKLKLLLPFRLKKLKKKNQSLNKNELLKRKIPKKMRK